MDKLEAKDTDNLIGMICILNKKNDSISTNTKCEILTVDSGYNKTIKIRSLSESRETVVRIYDVTLMPRNKKEFEANLALIQEQEQEVQKKIEFMEDSKLEEFNEDSFKIYTITEQIVAADNDKAKISKTIAEIIL